jgi:uroporphyrinogen III methyltransferase/synthase
LYGGVYLQAMDTLVLLMGGKSLAAVVHQLQQQGRAAETAVAVVREAAGSEQQVWRGTLGGIVQQTAGESLSPCVIIIGGAADFSM